MKQFLGKVKFWMDKFLSIACAVLLSFMTILVLIQVFSRYVLNSPVAFTEELVRYSLIWTGFIGAAYAFSTRWCAINSPAKPTPLCWLPSTA